MAANAVDVYTVSTLNESNYALNNTVFNDENVHDMAEIGRMVEVIGRPIPTVLGTIGNLLAFFVMRRGSLNKVSTCFYMSVLALADTGVLWCGAFVTWIGWLTNWTVDADTFTDCKLGYFLFYFCRHYSSSLLVIMSVEKFFALYFPLKTKSICTVRTAKWVSFVSALLYAAFDFQFFFIYKAETDTQGYKICVWTLNSDAYEPIFYQIDASLFSFIPLALMITANCAIIYKFMKAKCGAQSHGTESTSQALSKSAMKGTAMLITVSLTFVALTGPVSIVYMVTHIPNPLTRALVTIPQYLNHSINGVLYCIVGSRFRNELMDMLCCSRGKASSRRDNNKYVSENTGSTEIQQTAAYI